MPSADRRIAYVSSEPFPSRWTDTQQVIKTAAAMAGRGADVDLVTPRPWDRLLFADAGTRRRRLADYYGVDAGFGLVQLVGPPHTPLRLEKFKHGFLAPLWVRFAGHDLVLTRNVWVLTWSVALGIPSFFEHHKLIAEQYPVGYRLLRLSQGRPALRGVITNAEIVARHYREIGFDPEAVLVARNGYDPGDMEPRLDRDEARRRLDLPQAQPIAVYAGHIQRKKGIDLLLEIAARTPEVRFVICGGFEEDVRRARRVAREVGADNVRFTGWVDVPQLAPWLYAADVLVIPPSRAPFRRHGNTVLPIKTYSYLAAGRVILAPRMPDVGEVLRDGDNAVLVEPDDPETAAEALRRIVADPELRRRIGARAREDARRYTWSARAGRVLEFLRNRTGD